MDVWGRWVRNQAPDVRLSHLGTPTSCHRAELALSHPVRGERRELALTVAESGVLWLAVEYKGTPWPATGCWEVGDPCSWVRTHPG